MRKIRGILLNLEVIEAFRNSSNVKYDSTILSVLTSFGIVSKYIGNHDTSIGNVLDEEKLSNYFLFENV